MKTVEQKLEQLHQLINTVFADKLHHKQQLSLSYAALSLLSSRQLRLHEMGVSLAIARGVEKKHATKQIDRLLSNPHYDIWEMATSWVPHVVGENKHICVALDWTSYHADKQHMLALNLLTKQGCSTPLLWKTVPAHRLKHNRARYEDQLLSRLKAVIPEDVEVTVIVDRGFMSQAFFRFLTKELAFNYIIRLKKNITVTNAKGESRKVQDWQRVDGRARCLANVGLTKAVCPVEKLVIVKDKGMQDSWCLASNLTEKTPRAIINLYSKRWKIEPYFRDVKDSRFGYGLREMHIRSDERRDRLFLIIALTYLLLTVLGQAGETIGLSYLLKVNTVKTRTHSLFRQGQYYLDYFQHLAPDKQDGLIDALGKLLLYQGYWFDLLQ